MSDFAKLRERMVERQIAARGIDDPALLAAFRAVPREEFVAPEYAGYAYSDWPLPIESGQTIIQPYIVALMIDAAGIGPGDKVLEVGAGSGYAAAVIGQIAREVIAIERHPTLAEVARERIAALGYRQCDDRRWGRNPRLAEGRAVRRDPGRGGGGSRPATTARPAPKSWRAAGHAGWPPGLEPVVDQGRPQRHGGVRDDRPWRSALRAPDRRRGFSTLRAAR